jgi:mannose-6-phosphate isomerase-like protein (cupin superfamily)
MSEKDVKLFKLSEPDEARPSSQGCPLTFLVKKEKITCGTFTIPPGKRLGRISAHSGDEVYLVLKGTLWVELPRYEETVEVGENEGFYMAGGTIHAPHNLHGTEDTLVFWFCTPDWY